ncbi:Nramp family divalent metal transporter [Paraburkholderia caballeronis]|uniref:Divalent metal cation transporter MntH n=1 Tax=Paraburkholderia caballeronis TaxID=416943 RepID=A0A1H7QHT2_9BURK|nr:Nramp family divalent metal transporter [Paraburkholderia caballeronis]PXW22551.1 manganese transport protein [Paraburkholderia caballeronis]PXW96422.1 manganese transport protein [Paraburkholderia caballeronis]RAJ92833.1 manganese transport protein [Paraburkholderia caballeronis]SEE06145.1 manganese transport protein [Paraburkholderia caballeronis]SEL47486.1 manganese transport protein [Paraburkholderia caballeronis]
MQFRLPTTATAPFCPSEVQGTVAVSPRAPFWKKIWQFAGPGLLVSIGYMDPGNWATDIEAGSRYGYSLLFVVVLSSLAAIVLQCLSMRLGIVTGRDLAQLSRDRYSKPVVRGQWVLAEISIIACDLAEVLGGALAFHLLLGCSLMVGVVLTAFDTLIVLGLKGKNFRTLEAIMAGLIATIGLGYVIQLALVHPHWPSVAHGLIPSWQALSSREPMYLAIGILGATVMPHNLYLHSSIVQTRAVKRDPESIGSAIGLSRIDTIVSLVFALLINAAILILAAAAFHETGHTQVTEIEDAFRLLAPIVGTGAAAILFGITLLASGQSSTFTGTVAGQVIMEGFLQMKIPCWQRRLITRVLALIPAVIGVAMLGNGAVGRLLVASQVVLSLQLPFALWPLIRMTNDRALMGAFVNRPLTRALAWFLFVVVSAANLWLVLQTFGVGG